MTVYVDRMRARRGRFVFCHMLADSDGELFAMADCIGVSRRWVQYPGTYRCHFDISLAKRQLALRAGAIVITRRQLGRLLIARRSQLDSAEPALRSPRSG